MKYLSVCSGIEAASVAWETLEWEPLAFSEIEAFPRAVLSHHYPHVPLHGDFTKLRDEPWIAQADILVGGTPCQAFSVAGLRQSLNDDRGNLTLEFVRLADAIDDIRPTGDECIILWENVPGVLSVKDNAFGCFLAALVGNDTPIVPERNKWSNAGMVVGPKRRAAWRILDAQYFGLAQRRRRVFVVASARGGFDPAEVLFEREGVQRHSAPSREAGKGFAGYAASSLGAYSESRVGGSLRANGGDLGGGLENLIGYAPPITHALRAEGFDASEDGTGRGTPLVPVAYRTSGNCGAWETGDRVDALTTGTDPNSHVLAFTAKDYGGDAMRDLSPTLRSGGHADSHANAGVRPAVAFAQNTRDEVRLQGGDGQITGALQAEGGTKQTTYVAHAIQAGALRTKPPGIQENSSSTIVASHYAVRRLTPVECERLQGFPDNYTAIPWRKKPASECSDGPRYKALGNSMAVPVIRWIGTRIEQETKHETQKSD